jgi:hypothetical protein
MLIASPGLHVCPQWGKGVSAFSAGRARCGADQDQRGRPGFATRAPAALPGV